MRAIQRRQRYDDSADRSAQLERFRQALPKDDVLKAKAPGDSQAGKADNHPATLPGLAAAETVAINGILDALLGGLDELVAAEPASIDDTRATWGPAPDEDGVGFLFLTVQEDTSGSGSQRPLGFTVRRSADETLTAEDPIVLTGASDGVDSGVVLLDLAVSDDFDQANDPAHQPAEARGVFVLAYALDQSYDASAGTLSMVATLFRGEAAGDVRYFYGEIESADPADGSLFWFNFESVTDATGDGANETISVSLAHALGAGRGEVEYTDAGTPASFLECWNGNLAQTLRIDGWSASDDQSACGAPFASTLAELKIPELADVPLDELADCIVEKGVSGDCD